MLEFKLGCYTAAEATQHGGASSAKVFPLLERYTGYGIRLKSNRETCRSSPRIEIGRKIMQEGWRHRPAARVDAARAGGSTQKYFGLLGFAGRLVECLRGSHRGQDGPRIAGGEKLPWLSELT